MTTDLANELAAHRAAVGRFIEAAAAVPAGAWDRPRAPGKWTPAQVAEHVALAMDASTSIMQGDNPSAAAPRWLRPIVRALWLGPVLRRGGFSGRDRAPKGFGPSVAGVRQVDLRARLEGSLEAFQRVAAACGHGGRTTFMHPLFGRLAWADYVRLSALHAAHHQGQLGSP